MPTWVKIAKQDDVPLNDAIAVPCGKLSIAVFNVDGELFAINNLCPHAAGPLWQGFVENGRVTCPWHGWSFPLSPLDPPNDGLPRYPLRLDDGAIEIEIPDEQTPHLHVDD